MRRRSSLALLAALDPDRRSRHRGSGGSRWARPVGAGSNPRVLDAEPGSHRPRRATSSGPTTGSCPKARPQPPAAAARHRRVVDQGRRDPDAPRARCTSRWDRRHCVCSGSVVNDSRQRQVARPDGRPLRVRRGRTRQFATNWVFIPEYDSESDAVELRRTPVHGCWTAEALVVHSGYATAGSFNTQATVHDFAFAVVGSGGKSGAAQLDATVGSFPISFSGDQRRPALVRVRLSGRRQVPRQRPGLLRRQHHHGRVQRRPDRGACRAA